MSDATDTHVDLRLVPAAVAGWVGAIVGTSGAVTTTGGRPVVTSLVFGVGVVPVSAAVAAAAVSLVGARGRGARGRTRLVALTVLAVMVGAGALLGGVGRVAAAAAGPVVPLAQQRSTATVELEVSGDPLPRARPTGGPSWQDEQVRLTASVVRVWPEGARSPPVLVSTPVVVIAPTGWADLRPGDVVAVMARFALPTRPGPVCAVLLVDDDPTVVGRSPTPLTVGDRPRAALRESVRSFAPDRAGLLPSLVVGDETLLTERTREHLRVTGLAHLTAVSGANVAIVLGAVLITARWVGVRGPWLIAVGVAAVAMFVLLARPEPSVVRASAMGLVVVLGLLGGHRRAGRGIAPLALAISVLLLADPWLARSIGFALSCAATAGIVLLARPWFRAASTWMPRPVAAALSVPLAAQLACTPLLVDMADELSLSALPANMLAAPAVPAATVLGIVAAVVGVLWPAAAEVVAAVAMLPTGWIVLVADRAASLPGTVLPWTWGVPIAALGTAVLVAAVPIVLRSPVASVTVCAALVVMLLRPGHGWPPPEWSVVACDVGQGDAVVLRAGPTEALVVDAGPDPAAVDACLDDLGVTDVPLVVISHYHADHSAGLAGVAEGRRVGQVLVTVLDQPAEQAADLARWAAENGVGVRVAHPGHHARLGRLHWQVLWPTRVIRGVGSAPNQASVVLRVQVDGLSLLLTGDIEPAAQQALLASAPQALDVDVLKVPHHGSADQHPEFLKATTPAVALFTVGKQNTYGHPAPETLSMLASTGAAVARTDLDGDVAVVGPSRAGGHEMILVRRGSL